MAGRDGMMVGKVCLVTGATSGLGRATACELAARGADVVIVGRCLERCEAATEAIRHETGNPNVTFLRADLSSQAEVRRLAAEFLDRHERLDVLVNNAGALFATWSESADGIEMTLALNHLAYFLLTNLLLDTLKASAPARIVNVASDSHEMVKGFDFDDPQGRARYRRLGPDGRSGLASGFFTFLAPMAHPGLVQYAQTKLANLLFTYELSRRLEGTGVTVNAVHPGFVATDFTSGNGVFGLFMRFWARILAMRVEDGAKTSIHLATSPEVEGISGRYYVKQRPHASSLASRDEAASRRLWQLSEELTGFHAPERSGERHV